MPTENNEALAAFANLVMHCAAEPEFVAQFNRLTGCNLGQSASRSALDMAIDSATGHRGESETDMAKFIAFVFETVWLTLPQTGQPAASGQR